MGTTIATAGPTVIKSTNDTIDQLCVDTIRTLAMDAVQAANSGHPGTPMALAPVIYCLWQRVLRFDPSHPIWPNRDRFVLSVGHASMLLYAMLHLSGVRAGRDQADKATLRLADRFVLSVGQIPSTKRLDDCR